jgi:hypothetical protein
MPNPRKIFVDGETYDVYRQDPSDRLNYGWDYSKLLGSGDRVISSVYEIDGIAYANVDPIPADVTVKVSDTVPHLPTFTDTSTTVWLESGGSNLAYFVRNRIESEQGIIKDSTFILEIMRQ